jgi:hypothetical protein
VGAIVVESQGIALWVLSRSFGMGTHGTDHEALMVAVGRCLLIVRICENECDPTPKRTVHTLWLLPISIVPKATQPFIFSSSVTGPVHHDCVACSVGWSLFDGGDSASIGPLM